MNLNESELIEKSLIETGIKEYDEALELISPSVIEVIIEEYKKCFRISETSYIR